MLGAQENAGRKEGEGADERERKQLPASITRAVRGLTSAFERPLHPVIKGVAAGGGIGAGLAYDDRIGSRWRVGSEALITVRRFSSLLVTGGYANTRVRFDSYARLRDMPELTFFGLGPQSHLSQGTSFQLREGVLGARASYQLAPWLAIGGRVEDLSPSVSGGHSAALPSIERHFGEFAAPGLTSQPRFGRYQVSLGIDIPAAAGEAPYQGSKFSVSYAIFEDRAGNQHDFQRWDLEALQGLALLGAQRRLTIYGWLSLAAADRGSTVPFYLMETLGGKGELRSVSEERIEPSGTSASLRAFRNYRFRDRNLLLLQAEYRVPLWELFDATVFVDAGKVADRRADLDLARLRRSYGFSVSAMRGPEAVVRIDVGFGGGEGTHVWFSFGRGWLP
ncbi:MAG: hypothetical protein ACT4R6_12995 [Gemmatimonadaceae bacterium]